MKPHSKLAHRVIEGQAFIMDPRDSMLHALNGTATVVWREAAKGAAPEAIARAVAEEFEVGPEEARRDVEAFLAGLRKKGLLIDD